MKPDNKPALLRGILNRGTFPSLTLATLAAMEFAVDAHDGGHALSGLAVLMNKSDSKSVNVTLARRHYWRNIAPELIPSDVLTRLAAQDDKDSLLVLVVHEEFASHEVLTLAEMKEALSYGQV